MAAPIVRLYAAASLDGFIADAGGGVSWLDPYNSVDYGYETFMQSIGPIIMGRKTFDQALTFPGGWPYTGKQTIVLTNRPIESPPVGVEAYNGDLRKLVSQLQATSEKDIWLCGGGQVIAAFLREGLIDQIELYLIPIMLGGGVPLFGSADVRATLELKSSRPFSNGVMELIYRVPRVGSV